MDNLTHAALGLSVGVVVAKRGGSLPAAAVAALLAAEAPDLDVFIRNADDPLVSFRWHRHFTHSFAFMPVWAVLSAFITVGFFRWINQPWIPWRSLLLPAFAGVLTHLLCDGCTSYGTMLLWPINHFRYAWDCLPIVDLFATLPLVVMTIVALKLGSKKWASYGLAWFTCYALLGVWQHHRAENTIRQYFASEAIAPERLAIKPTISNLILWRVVWLEKSQWHIAAVRVAPGSESQIALGDIRAAWSPAAAGNPPPGTFGEKIIRDFSQFTQNWNAYSVTDTGILVGDIRFGMLPTSGRCLWSVCYGGDADDRHLPPVTKVVMNRDIQSGDWSRFGALLLGTDPAYRNSKR
jgi:inner membrane protein